MKTRFSPTFDHLEKHLTLSAVGGELPAVGAPDPASLDIIFQQALIDQARRDLQEQIKHMNDFMDAMHSPPAPTPPVVETSVWDDILFQIDSMLKMANEANIPLFHP